MAQVQVMQGMVRETENIEVRYTCDGCGTITKTMTVLNQHIYKEHKVILHVFFSQVMEDMNVEDNFEDPRNTEVRYSCDGCGTITKTMTVLNKHIYKVI